MKNIRLLVVDDSAIVHLVLEKSIRKEDNIDIVGQAYDGEQGVLLTHKFSPDVIVMDINMPGMDGLNAIQEIMSEKPTPIIVFSSASKDIVDLSFKSIELGAVDIIEKPASSGFESLKQNIQQRLLRSVKTFADIKVIRRMRKSSVIELKEKNKNLQNISKNLEQRHRNFIKERQKNYSETETLKSGESFPVIAIAASTGGPQTIRRLLENTHFKHISAGIVIVQHMAEGFMGGYGEWLKGYSPFPVTIAQSDEHLEPCHVYVAPGEYHLGISPDYKFLLIDSPPEMGIRPSANILLKHMAEVYRDRLITVILTGMGDDGTRELSLIKEYGGHIVAQDEESSILFGMPKAAIQTGFVDTILSLSQIPQYLVQCCLEKSCE